MMPLVLASIALSRTLALIAIFGGIGLVVNVLIVVAVLQALGERKQNLAMRRFRR